MLGTHIRYTRPTDPPSPVAAKRGAQLTSCKYGRCQPMTLLRDGAPCCSQRPAPRSLRPWPMILVCEVIWLPRERPNSSTSSDGCASKSSFGGYRGVEPAVAVTCGSTTPRRLWMPLTATVPRLPNGMERKAGRAYRSVLDLVVVFPGIHTIFL